MKLPEETLAHSFNEDDFILLLSESKQAPVSVKEKEKLIVSGGHYSDVFVKEYEMSNALKDAYQYALKENNGAKRIAYHIQYLSHELVSRHPDNSAPLVLISLVRAGVPLGVLLTRYIRKYYPDIHVYHYGISIIRGRGIDNHALQNIHEHHPDSDYYFVDGWTGKGSISTELRDSLKISNLPFDYRLVVDSDPAGTSSLSATKEDWLIPFGLVGAQVSGLFSRTLWSDKGYHKAALFTHLADDDISRSFINEVEKHTAIQVSAEEYPNDGFLQYKSSPSSEISAADVVCACKSIFNLDSVHKIKPGIAEATRAVHRRTPAHIVLRSEGDPETVYLERLAKERGVNFQIGLNGGMGPFRAITILS